MVIGPELKMLKIPQKLTVIKYGTETLARKDASGKFSVDYKTIREHGGIINDFGKPILMVSSGAVGTGRTVANFDYIEDKVVKKRVLAAAGNPRLSINWDEAIREKVVLQGLITHKDFFHADSRSSLENIISGIYQNPVYAVVQFNDNDFITDEEIHEARGGEFGDNDELTALVAELCAEVFESVEVIVNTCSDGVIKNQKSIAEMSEKDMTDEKITALCGGEKTKTGMGGMGNKLKIFRDLAVKTGITTHVINGRKPEQLKRVLEGISVGTKIFRQ